MWMLSVAGLSLGDLQLLSLLVEALLLFPMIMQLNYRDFISDPVSFPFIYL